MDAAEEKELLAQMAAATAAGDMRGIIESSTKFRLAKESEERVAAALRDEDERKRQLAARQAGGSAPRRRRAGARTKLADAIGAQTRHPDWTYKELARHVGCTEQYLKNSHVIKAVKKAIREDGAAQHHRSRRGRGASNMDAYEAPRRGDEADVG